MLAYSKGDDHLIDAARCAMLRRYQITVPYKHDSSKIILPSRIPMVALEPSPLNTTKEEWEEHKRKKALKTFFPHGNY